MTEQLRVREIDDDEEQRLVRIIRRSSGSVVTWRRAQMVLLSAQGMDVPAIARVAFTSGDRVRDVIRDFNADGFGSLLVMTDDKQTGWRALLWWRRIPKAPWRMIPKPPQDEPEDKKDERPDLEETLEWKELKDQFYWYDRRAKGNHTVFSLLKILTLVLGGAVTVLAALNSSAALTASLAAAIVVAEGIQQLFALQKVWLDYQDTALELRGLAMSYFLQEKPKNTDEAKARLRQLGQDTQTILDKEASHWKGLRSRDTSGSGS